MKKVDWAQHALQYLGMGIVISLMFSLAWDSSNGFGGSEMFTGLALLLAIGAIIYLKSMQNVTEREVTRRIRSEYPSEVQPQVFEVYRHLRIKEMDGLFSKILDEANGDINKVRKLASVAESVGWRSFIENHW